MSRRSFGLLVGGTAAASLGGGAATYGYFTDRETASGQVVAADSFPPQRVHLNTGAGQYTAGDGTVFAADDFYSGGQTATTGDAIGDTQEDTLYQSERYGVDLGYDVPIQDGTYDVLLHFNELYWNSEGQRVFDVSLEGNQVITDLDIYAEVGHDVAYRRAFEDVSVSDGTLTITTTTSVDNSKFSAIEIVPATDSIHVNAGGPPLVDSTGTLYLGDQYYGGGNEFTTADSIANTNDDALYRTERWQNTLTYDVPVSNGTYDVTLHFAEIWATSDGTRVFDVDVEGTTVLTNYDIHAEVGHDVATTESVTGVQVTDGSLTIDMAASQNNAKISAIDVVPQ